MAPGQGRLCHIDTFLVPFRVEHFQKGLDVNKQEVIEVTSLVKKTWKIIAFVKVV